MLLLLKICFYTLFFPSPQEQDVLSNTSDYISKVSKDNTWLSTTDICNVEPNLILKYDDSGIMKFMESLRNTSNQIAICVKTYPDYLKLLKN